LRAVARVFQLADLFEIVADEVPDRLALVAGPRRLTYRELDTRATRAAHALADRGVTTGDHVAIISWNRAEWVETMFGLYKLAAVPVNVNYRYTASEIAYMLENSNARFVVCEPEFVDVVDDVAPGASPGSRLVFGPEYEAALEQAVPTREGLPARSADDLYLLYTGGTTGVPKGVMWRHEDIFFAALGGGGFGQPPIATPEEIATRIQPEATRAVNVCNAPMMHGGGQWVTMIGLLGGGTVVLSCERHFDGDWVWRTVAAEGANSVMVVGDAMARPLADALASGEHDAAAKQIAVIGSGGGILSKSVKSQLRALAPHAAVMDSFGASETGAGGAVLDLDRDAAGPRFTMGPHMSVLGDDLRPVSPGSGVVGRLARRGHIPLGYYGDRDKTAATFVVDADGQRWVVPGDAALIEADGTITLLGRGSVCINTGGEKVYPEEVEAIVKAHPDVFDCVVVGVPDERFGERVCALVEPRPGRNAPSLDAIQAFCRGQLAGYKMPRALVVLDRVERTPVGKPDYRWARSTAERSLGERAAPA
jgi:fatty-acyl-CoA synthase